MTVDLALDIILVCLMILIVVIMPLFLYSVIRMIIAGYQDLTKEWRDR